MKIAESTTFGDRLRIAFGGETLPKIAEKLGVNYHTLRNWAKGRSDIPSSELIKIAEATKISLNWLLTGQGDKYLLGDMKEFDVELFVEKHDDWRDVMNEWFAFEGKEMPDTGASFMGGWRNRTKEERIDAVRDLKDLLDRTVKDEK